MTVRIFFLLCVAKVCSAHSLDSIAPFYDINAKLDTTERTLSVQVNVQIPAEMNLPGDTIWFHLWANAFSNTGNEFTEEQLKYGLSNFYFRDETLLSKITDLKVSVNQNSANYVFKDESKEILGVIIGNQNLFSGAINIEYILKLPALINGLGYEKGNYYLRNFYPKLAIYENKAWQTYQYRQFLEEWGYNADVLLKLNGMEGFSYYSNGIKSHQNPIEISAKNVKELAIFMLRTEHKGLLKTSVNKDITYQLISTIEATLSPEEVDSTIQKVAFRLSEYLGKFPFESLTIVIGKGCYSCFKTDGMVMVNEPQDGNSVEEWLVSILTDVWISGKFVINTESYPWLVGGLTTYFQDIYNEDFLTKDEKESAEFGSFYYKYLYWYQRSRITKPLNTNRNILNKDLECLNRYYKSAAFLHYLSAMVGKENFSSTLAHFISSRETLTPDNLIERLEQISRKELKVIADNYISRTCETDYKIHSINYNDGKLQISVENLKTDALPFILTIENKDGLETVFLVNGFKGTKTIAVEIDDQDDINVVSIDKAGFLPEINRENNHYYPGKTCKHGTVKLANLFKTGDSRVKELCFLPFPLYNDNDGVMAGLTISNSNVIDPKLFRFAISPVYSFRNKKLLGQAWTSYDQYLSSDIFKRVRYRLGLKSFDLNTNSEFNYSQRYVRIDPSVTFHFRHEESKSIESSLSIKSFFINEEYPTFAGSEFFNLENRSSIYYRMTYNLDKVTTLSSSSLNIALEDQSYKQTNESIDKEHYFKLSTTFNQRYLFAVKKNIIFRFFASGFLINTQRQSGSFQNIFTRGSIAMIHQGYNDYTYDEYFFSRQNQTRLYDNQTSFIEGGGFKTPLGSAHSYGMSNHYAVSLNLSTDVPFIPAWIPLRLYFDVGTFSVYNNGDNKFKNNLIYNGGFSFNFKDILVFHIPMIYSTELGNAYKGQHHTFLSRISFSLNLNKFDLWDMTDPFEE
ncbi:MAG: hypothetical protein H7X99_05665 [Saprospiraceae bacterium]|nr:hypothetical protein [Saprospiraceae bacterium]